MTDPSWIRTIDASALDEFGVAPASASGQALALYVVDGEYFATADLCTHGAARLSEGYLDGDLIECPLHQGLFDVRTGEPAGAPCTVAVRTFPVRKDDDGFLYVSLGESGDA